MKIIQHAIAVLVRIIFCLPLLAIEGVGLVLGKIGEAMCDFSFKGRRYFHVIAPVPWMTHMENVSERDRAYRREKLLKEFRDC